MPLAKLDGLSKPVLVMLLDDGPTAAGPDGWPALAEVRLGGASTFPTAQGLPRAGYEVLVQEVVARAGSCDRDGTGAVAGLDAGAGRPGGAAGGRYFGNGLKLKLSSSLS